MRCRDGAMARGLIAERPPERTGPRALVLGTLGVSLVYVALNTVFLYAPLPEAILGVPRSARRRALRRGIPIHAWNGAGRRLPENREVAIHVAKHASRR